MGQAACWEHVNARLTVCSASDDPRYGNMSMMLHPLQAVLKGVGREMHVHDGPVHQDEMRRSNVRVLTANRMKSGQRLKNAT